MRASTSKTGKEFAVAAYAALIAAAEVIQEFDEDPEGE